MKLSLGDSHFKKCKHEFERKIENIYYMSSLNDMNSKHDNKSNNIAECNLLHDTLNPPKLTKNINSHCYFILKYA